MLSSWVHKEMTSPHIKQGDKINVGDLLIEFDKDAIKEAGYELDTDVIVTNTNDY